MHIKRPSQVRRLSAYFVEKLALSPSRIALQDLGWPVFGRGGLSKPLFAVRASSGCQVAADANHFASRLRFWAVAARRNSSWGPRRPLSRTLSSFSIRLRCAKRAAVRPLIAIGARAPLQKMSRRLMARGRPLKYGQRRAGRPLHRAPARVLSCCKRCGEEERHAGRAGWCGNVAWQSAKTARIAS